MLTVEEHLFDMHENKLVSLSLSGDRPMETLGRLQLAWLSGFSGNLSVALPFPILTGAFRRIETIGW